MFAVYADSNDDPVCVGDKFRWETTDMQVVGFDTEDKLVLLQDDDGATYGYSPMALGAVWV